MLWSMFELYMRAETAEKKRNKDTSKKYKQEYYFWKFKLPSKYW